VGSGEYRLLTVPRHRLNLCQGNIGAADGGLPFLEEEEIVEQIVEIAEGSSVLSIRG
jgi:hypothetical protein